MVLLNGKNGTIPGSTVFHKVWYFLRAYILTLPRFDLFLQGALLIILLLEGNAYLLLRRDAGTGHLPARIEDWVMVGAGGAEFVLGACVGWWGRSRRHLALSAWFAVTALSGLLVLAFPYEDTSPPSVELCDGTPVSVYSLVHLSGGGARATARMVFLVVTAVMCALARLSIWAHGLSYLDDHAPQDGPYFYGILISIRLSLGLSGQSWLRAGAVREDWWEAQLSLAMLTLMFAVLFTLFPRTMPQWKHVDEPHEIGFLASVQRVVRNKPIVLQTIGMSLMNAALFGFVNFDTAFIQARFHIEAMRQDPQTSRAASNIFRPLVIIFFIMIFRMRFSVRRSDGVKANTAARVGGVVAIFAAVFFAVLAALPCSSEIEGLDGAHYVPPTCSQECTCNSERYGFSPVCALDSGTTYFSPCSAGCNQYEDLNGFPLFHNCTCGTGSARAVRGSCAMASCRLAYTIYQVVFTVVVAICGAALLMQGMAVVRAVRRRGDKALALAVSFAAIALLSHVLGHLLYMLISHLTCAYEGSSGRACVLHQADVWWLPVASAALALCSACVSLLASRTMTSQHHPSGHSSDDT